MTLREQYPLSPCALPGEWAEPVMQQVYGYGAWVQCLSRNGNKVYTGIKESCEEAAREWAETFATEALND